VAVNTDLNNLVASQSFVNDAVFNRTSYTATGIGEVQDGGRTQLTIAYDAASRSYTLTVPGTSETFGAAEYVGAEGGLYRDFQRETATTASFFSIGTPSLEGERSYRYVNGGYWQRNLRKPDGEMELSFYPFTFGLSTAAANLPRSGTAGYAIDLFGFYTNLRQTSGSRVVTGDGTINVDFSKAQLQLDGSVFSYDFVNGGRDQATLPFSGTGTIAADASFSGAFQLFSASKFAGRFYGPRAEELGAVFWSEDPDEHFEGTIVGQQADDVPRTNFLLTDLVADQEFRIIRMLYDTHGRLGYSTDGSYSYISDISQRDRAPVFRPSDRIASLSSPEYTVYGTTHAGNSYQLGLATPGQVEGVRLYYASFGEISILSGPDLNTTSGAYSPMSNNQYFTYGLTPSVRVMTPSGHGIYNGIVIGRAINSVDNWSVSGTSLFNLNFQDGTLSALFKMAGTSLRGGAALIMPDLVVNDGYVNFDNGGLSGPISLATSGQGSATLGHFAGQLYGPTGEELGGIARFSLYNFGGTDASTEVALVALGSREP